MTAQGKSEHLEETVQQLAALYEEHDRNVSPVQRLANRATAALGRPLALTVIVALVLAWVIGNYVARWLGSPAFEEFPFPDLEFVATVVGLVVALLILSTQRHEEQLAERRERLTLQIALLSEKKIAKIIQLLEEQRQDNPLLQSRIDREANAMAIATDPISNLDRLEASEGKNSAGSAGDDR